MNSEYNCKAFEKVLKIKLRLHIDFDDDNGPQITTKLTLFFTCRKETFLSTEAAEVDRQVRLNPVLVG